MSDTDDPRLTALYRRVPVVEPAGETDAAILAAARRATRRRRHLPWAVVATLLLGVGIGWRVLHLEPSPAGIAPPEPPAVTVEPARSREHEAVEADRVARSKARDAKPAMPQATAQETAPAASAAKRHRPQRVAPGDAAPNGVTVQRARVSTTAPSGDAAAGDCVAGWPVRPAPEQAWRERLRNARAAGDAAVVRCLETRYRERFGEPPAEAQ